MMITIFGLCVASRIQIETNKSRREEENGDNSLENTIIHHLEVEGNVGLGEINIQPCCHVDTRHKVQVGVEQPGHHARVLAPLLPTLLLTEPDLGTVLPHN